MIFTISATDRVFLFQVFRLSWEKVRGETSCKFIDVQETRRGRTLQRVVAGTGLAGNFAEDMLTEGTVLSSAIQRTPRTSRGPRRGCVATEEIIGTSSGGLTRPNGGLKLQWYKPRSRHSQDLTPSLILVSVCTKRSDTRLGLITPLQTHLLSGEVPRSIPHPQGFTI